VHAHGDATGTGIEVIARERALAAFVESSPCIEGEGMGGNDHG
jgi:hypothetical protein